MKEEKELLESIKDKRKQIVDSYQENLKVDIHHVELIDEVLIYLKDFIFNVGYFSL